MKEQSITIKVTKEMYAEGNKQPGNIYQCLGALVFIEAMKQGFCKTLDLVNIQLSWGVYYSALLLGNGKAIKIGSFDSEGVPLAMTRTPRPMDVTLKTVQ